ncbi:VanZ family protein [Mesobacillus subterraneus]|uniref:VanZ family protein n=1 Tax=Mesobacillus subterraneus TaxID=285983 RepID=UPI00203F7DB5|nr:VanZ family protein [Mesobacillus subterraneus]MCM3574045.1 VanZ family protein [Mesobacillus subterraneus]
MIQLWRGFGDLVPLFFLVVLIAGITAFILGRKKKMGFKYVVLNTLFVLSVFGILLVTMLPQYGIRPRVINIVPFAGMYNLIIHSVDISVPIRNLGLNALLFVPFGLFLSMKKSYLQSKTIFKIVVVSGLLLSVSIESIQYTLPLGRSADIDDVILNTIGALLGFISWKVLQPSSSLAIDKRAT